MWEATKESFASIFHRVVHTLQEWIAVKEKGANSVLTPIPRAIVSWLKPSTGFVNYNVDASFFAENNKVVIGILPQR